MFRNLKKLLPILSLNMRAFSSRFPSFVEMSKSSRANFVITKEKGKENRESSKQGKESKDQSQSVDFEHQGSTVSERGADQLGQMASTGAKERSSKGEGRSTIGQKQENRDMGSEKNTQNTQNSGLWGETRKDPSGRVQGPEDPSLKRSSEDEARFGGDRSGSRMSSSEEGNRKVQGDWSGQQSSGARNFSAEQMQGPRTGERDIEDKGMKGSWEKENRLDTSSSGKMDSNFNVKNQGKTFSEQGTSQHMQSTKASQAGHMSADARKLSQSKGAGNEEFRRREQEASGASREGHRGQQQTSERMKEQYANNRPDQGFPGMSREERRSSDEIGDMPAATSGQTRGMESSQRFFEGTQRVDNPETMESSEKRGQQGNLSGQGMKQEQRGQESQAFGKSESRSMGREEAQGKRESQGRQEAQGKEGQGVSREEEGKGMKREEGDGDFTWSEMLIVSSNTDWEGLKQHDKPVILDFYKDGCGVCKRLYPKLAHRAKKGRGKYVMAGANIEKEKVKPLAENLNVDVAPTVMLFYRGKVVQQFSGQDEGELNKLFDKAEELSNK